MTITSATAVPPTVTMSTRTAQPPATKTAADSAAPSTPQQHTAPVKQPSVVAAMEAAKARYMRTGIDKDAAMGDPDHDAPRKIIA